ncbi:MAG TPA: carboxyl transferase domain-containing protein [Thermodesulfobacteriota bacterium]|nr:carboxyl transferase domain-containing protein [Thermodesulfobacteriota bacterium]
MSTNKSKSLKLHDDSISYDRIKSKHVVENLYSDFIPWNELDDFYPYIHAPSGKRIEFQDDPAMIIGTAIFKSTGERVAIVAQQTPSDDSERIKLNFGLVKADGYGLSLNMMEYAERHNIMLHTYVDTIGGDPYEYSAEKLQSWLISYCQAKMISLKTKSISVVLGSGGSGGAIAIQLAHKRFMLSRAEYAVITSKGCSAILFRTADNEEEALKVLQPTADYMQKYGIIDDIIKEPMLDKADYFPKVLENINKALTKATNELKKSDVNYLREILIKNIEQCGQIEQHHQKYNTFARKLKKLVRSSFSKSKNPDVSQMQIALYGGEPYVCNDEKDQEGKVVRAGCKNQTTEDEFRLNYQSCPKCSKQMPLTSDEYIEMLLDDGSFNEIRPDISLDNIDSRFNFYDYSSSRQKMGKKTDSKDSLVVGYGMIFETPVAVAVSDFRFMGGSMGSVFGEKMRLITEYALMNKLPLISISATGGARMQEGTVALYQMAKTIASSLKLKEAGLPYITILGHPTTGGALASYAVQGDFIISEKKANIAFAGDRVVKLTSGGRGVDPEIMSSEFYEQHGGIHLVLDRKQIKSALAGILKVTHWYRNIKDTADYSFV